MVQPALLFEPGPFPGLPGPAVGPKGPKIGKKTGADHIILPKVCPDKSRSASLEGGISGCLRPSVPKQLTYCKAMVDSFSARVV